ncbi:MAG: cache domain-containing protein, partial [Desulfosarcinaceae bacterium]
MGITKKLTLMSLAGVLILGVLATIFSVQCLNKQGQAEIDAIERTLISEKKGKLQDLVRNTFAILEHKYHAAHDPKLVAAVYRRQLKSIVEVAYSAVERIYQEDGQSDEAKRQAAMDVIKAMRYQDQDYLWINDTHPTMVMHPFKPALDGKDLSGFKDPNGKFLFKEFAKTCRESGEGFVDYLWPRPG